MAAPCDPVRGRCNSLVARGVGSCRYERKLSRAFEGLASSTKEAQQKHFAESFNRWLAVMDMNAIGIEAGQDVALQRWYAPLGDFLKVFAAPSLFFVVPHGELVCFRSSSRPGESLWGDFLT